jgi:hypothetical protein
MSIASATEWNAINCQICPKGNDREQREAIRNETTRLALEYLQKKVQVLRFKLPNEVATSNGCLLVLSKPEIRIIVQE